MRPHRRVTRLHVGGQHDGDRRRVTALLAPAFEREAHGVGMRHIARERLEDGEPAARRRRSVRAAAAGRR